MTQNTKGASAPTTAPEHIPIAPVDFTDGVSTYRYDFSRVTVEGAETAVALLELQALRQQKGAAENELQLRRSGANEWQTHTLAFVLRKIEGTSVMPYDIDNVEKAHTLLKQLEGVQNYLKIKECVLDFFTGIGHGKTVSMLLQQPSSLNANALLTTLLMSAMQPQTSGELSLSGNSA